MENTPFNFDSGLHLPRDVQLQRVKRVIEGELTDLQRETIIAYYFQQKNISCIARERGVKVIGLSSTCYQANPSRHPTGLHLPDVVDLFIDYHVAM